ncbi:MAG: hypothetical protein IT323_05130 [Anaerolineae bacterium]|nr:hypothetical protein [Anaerolineae bacterium]
MAGNRSRNAPPPKKPNWALIGGLGALATVLIVVVVALLGSRGSSQPGSSPAAGAPEVSVSETEIDHGTQRFETPVESVFTVSNTGDAPLNILGEPRVELIEGC